MFTFLHINYHALHLHVVKNCRMYLSRIFVAVVLFCMFLLMYIMPNVVCVFMCTYIYIYILIFIIISYVMYGKTFFKEYVCILLYLN